LRLSGVADSRGEFGEVGDPQEDRRAPCSDAGVIPFPMNGADGGSRG
jgi:hypothetical protein